MVLDFVDTDGHATGIAPALDKRYFQGARVDQLLSQENVTQSTNSPNRVWWVLPDHLGSTRDVVTSTGGVVAHFQFDSFGVLLDGRENVTRYQFTGREHDGHTDLNYHRARWYDPLTGKWISEDPIGFAAGDANVTRYVGNGVLNATDPSGLHSLWFHAIDYPLAAAEWLLTFLAGALDSFSFQLWSLGQRLFGHTPNITYKSAYRAGEITEVAVEITITGGSAVLKRAAQKKIAERVAKNVGAELVGELSEAALKNAEKKARKAIETELRAAAQEQFEHSGEEIHHILTLWGHYGKGVPRGAKSHFPTLGVEWLANHSWNLMSVATRKQHASIHSRMYASEQAIMKVVGPWFTGTRTILDIAHEWTIDLKIEACKKE